MKKSTIIILLVVFLGSIFIVGMLGMKSVPYEEIVYIQKIELRSVSYTSGISGITADIKQNNVGEYYVVIPYSAGLQVLINYNITPADATNTDVEFSLTDSNLEEIAELDGSIIKFNKYGDGDVAVTLRSTDSVKDTSVVLRIILTQPKTPQSE